MNQPYSHIESSVAFEPTAEYAHLRKQCPVHHVADHDPPFFVVSRFDDVVDTLKQPALWGNNDGPGVFYQRGGVLGSADDPDHARHRAVLRRSFVPTNINTLEPRLTVLADDLLDEMLPLGTGDFVGLFAFPFPALAIGELLGVRAEDQLMFRDLADRIVAALTGGALEEYEQAKATLGDYIDARLSERDALPDDELPDDVLTAMLLARRDGRLNDHEVRHLGHQVLVAGHETTTSLLGMMLFRLMQKPDTMQRLRDDPTLIPAAVEESLRFDSPVNGLFRTNSADTTMHEAKIPSGSKLQVLFASANRDPARFPDPDVFDIDRPRRELGQHVAFGWGIHFCIGAPLARLETRVAFERILARTSHIELAGEPVRNESFVLHGLTNLPVRWTVA
jgi:cytochrome P450